MGLTKQQLEALNQSSFPNNNAGAITPDILRQYNVATIANTVNQDTYTTDSASFSSRILAITGSTTNTGSLLTTASFNAYTQSTNLFTASISTSVGLLQTFSGSEYKADSSSFDSRINSFASASIPAGTVSSSAQIAAFGYATTSSVTALSQSLYFTDTTQSVNVTQASASAWGAFQSASAYSASGFQADATQSFQITANALTASNATTALSQSLYFTDTTQSANINTNSSSVGLLQTFSGSQYKNDSSSFSSRIIAAGGSPQIQDEGTILGTATSFNFIGSGVTAIVSSGTASVTIPGGSAPAGTVSSSTQIVALGFATTSSNTFNGSQNIVGDITASGNLFVSGTITAYQLNTVIESSSVIFSSGSNILGDASTDVQTLNGQVNVVNALTASGLKYPTTDGTSGQFIITNGTGTLAFDDVHVLLEDVRYGENITIGDPLYVSGSNGNRPIVFKADASNSAKMPVIYIANSTAAANTNTTALTLGLITGVTTTGYAPGTTIYVAEGGGWSSSVPSGSSSIVQSLGIVTKEGAGGSGRGLVLNPGPATLPNLQTGYAWIGNGTNQPTAVATSSFVNINQTGSFATTGSNTFNGNQIINGALQVSSSATYDIDVTGSIQANSTIRVSGSTAINTITTSTSTISGSLGIGVIARGYSLLTINQNQIGLYASGSTAIAVNVDAPIGTSGIAVNSGSSVGAYYYPITFQTGPGYIDGTITTLRPLVISGSLFVSGATNFTELTGSLATFSSSVDSRILSVSGAYVATSASYNTLSSSFVAVSSSALTHATTGSNTFVGNQIITGSLIISSSLDPDVQIVGSLTITGSVATQPIAVTITSNTASIDFSKGSIYTLTLVSSSVATYITASNLVPGQTANLLVTQASALSGSITWASAFKFPSGSSYTGSAVVNAIDLVSFITVNNSTIYSVGAKQLQ